MEKKQDGHLHPLTSTIREIVSIFDELGFSVVEGPELEDEFHNFDALNVPPDHPSRDMQDTFWLPNGSVLRTHTTATDVRILEQMKDNPKPFKVVIPGKVFRNEATDATHEAQFFQIDGLYVNDEVSMAELKGMFEYFFKKLLGDEVKIRFRPSFFGFVEPGIEVDALWKGRWLELFGADLLHPHVLKSAGWDPKKWRGIAFGGGLDRLVMLRYGIDDVRHLYSGDLRLINQF